MKTRTSLWLLPLCLLLMAGGCDKDELVGDLAEESLFYYHDGKKIYLKIDYSHISVVSEQEISLKEIRSKVSTNVGIEYSEINHTRRTVIPLNGSEEIADEYITKIALLDKAGQATYIKMIQNLQKEKEIIQVSPSYLLGENSLGLSNNFYVKLRTDADKNTLCELADKHSMHVLGYNEFMPLWHTVSCTKETTFNALQAANLFYETGLFEYAEPEFLDGVKLAKSN